MVGLPTAMIAQQAAQGPVLVLILAGLALLLAVTLVFVRYVSLWLQATTTGSHISLLDLIGMTFRRVNAKAVVRAKIMATQAGVDIPLRALESASLQGVDLEKVNPAEV